MEQRLILVIYMEFSHESPDLITSLKHQAAETLKLSPTEPPHTVVSVSALQEATFTAFCVYIPEGKLTLMP